MNYKESTKPLQLYRIIHNINVDFYLGVSAYKSLWKHRTRK